MLQDTQQEANAAYKCEVPKAATNEYKKIKVKTKNLYAPWQMIHAEIKALVSATNIVAGTAGAQNVAKRQTHTHTRTHTTKLTFAFLFRTFWHTHLSPARALKSARPNGSEKRKAKTTFFASCIYSSCCCCCTF